jgi:acetyl-CoA C-acetyltransferase
MKVAVVGIGHGKFGKRDDATVQELAFEPFRDALSDASRNGSNASSWTVP